MYDRSDARWAVVKDLLHPDKRNFLPFDLSIYTPGNLLPDYVTRPSKFSLLLKKFAGVLIVMYWYRFYMHHVLKRIAAFSKLWHPSKGWSNLSVGLSVVAAFHSNVVQILLRLL